MQFSIAVCESAVLPPFPTQATCGLLFLMPKPLRKPLWRSAPTDEPACSSSIAIVTVRPLVAALAYFPIRTPALKLFVAKSASTADLGLAGSRARSRGTGLPRFGDCGILRLRVGHGNENPLHTGRHHVLDRGDLARVVELFLPAAKEPSFFACAVAPAAS